MQATIFGPAPGGGDDAGGHVVVSVRAVTDEGVAHDVDDAVLAASGLRHLRAGQRVSIDLDDGVVTRLWVVGIGEGETIR